MGDRELARKLSGRICEDFSGEQPPILFASSASGDWVFIDVEDAVSTSMEVEVQEGLGRTTGRPKATGVTLAITAYQERQYHGRADKETTLPRLPQGYIAVDHCRGASKRSAAKKRRGR